jgi:hypothetical protein
LAKSKWPEIKKNIPLIEKWCRDGLDEKQICKNLGIAVSTFENYKTRHKELVEALKRGKAVPIIEIENALYRRATGYEYEEVKTYIKLEGDREVKYTEKTKKHLPPDVAACFILLKNKDKGNWSDNPIKVDIDREMADFKKAIEREKLKLSVERLDLEKEVSSLKNF